MPSSFRKAITGTRYGVGTYTQGRWVEGTGTPLAFTASVQPISDKEMQLLPEARRTSAAYVLFSDTELRPASSPDLKNADRVSLYGDTFEVLSCGVWQNAVIPHYKSIVVKVTQ